MHVRRCLARAGGRTARDHRPPSARPPITSSPTPLTSTLLLRCATLPTLHSLLLLSCGAPLVLLLALGMLLTRGSCRTRRRHRSLAQPTRPPCTPSHSSSSSSRGHGMSRLLASDGHERTAGARSARPFAAALAARRPRHLCRRRLHRHLSLSAAVAALLTAILRENECFRAKNRFAGLRPAPRQGSRPGPAKPLSAGSPPTPDIRLSGELLSSR